MHNNVSVQKRNEAVECGRLLAAFCVVFLHLGFSNIHILREGINCATRIAVPFFFVISGYYAYQAPSQTVGRRIGKMVRLVVISMLVYFAWLCFYQGVICHQSVKEFLMGIFCNPNMANWVFLNVTPPAGHLWYLSAATVCWIVLWIYVKFQEQGERNNKYLYMICVVLFVFYIFLSLNTMVAGYIFPVATYRNALFFGLPMFGLGMFLHEYHDRIITAFQLNTPKLLAMTVVGMLLSVLQWRGIGRSEMPVGMVLTVIAVVLLLVKYPVISGNSTRMAKLISRFGRISTNIYVMHIMWAQIYGLVLKERLIAISVSLEACLQPFIVILVSLLFAGLCEVVYKGEKRCYSTR